jgi:UPF0755 protein
MNQCLSWLGKVVKVKIDRKIGFKHPNPKYKTIGTPPSPICNPGLAAINAVINSQETEYLYYLRDSEGQIHLAKTYKEHLENIKQYLK